ncbi:MAG: AsmA family protein [Gammaproteobacteria bacterium]|uniref:AsmA family protein n=1 Tax=Pseudomaricurvus alcaniphilus TaxID=1166482 RepID=UPI00140CDE66|nr:AsmA family protein [Pseudomaricurvus alcaniphilus]MBR9912185.1 AsmA family protein [Gammaproteobacteria bacterium]NHN38750.1 AsmA family protein [Pseudomaricurvus alcaniphilus]
MSRIFKLVAALVGILLLLLAALVFYITQLFDPNVLKPELEKLARERGIALYMPGPISWQWYPYLGLTLDNVRVGAEPLLAVERLSARLEIRPLLQRRVVISALTVSGAQLDLHRNARGVANWEELSEAMAAADAAATKATAAKPTAPTEAEPPAGQSLQLSIVELRVDGGRVLYRDEAAATRVQLSDLELEVDNLALGGETFQIRQGAKVQFNDLAPLQIGIEGQAGFDLRQQILLLDKIELQASAGKHPLNLSLSGQVALQPLAPELAVTLSPFALRQWLPALGVSLPVMAADDALNRIGLSAAIKGAEGNWQVNDLALQLDESTFSGQLRLSDSGAIKLGLRGDRFNLDRYLPPAAPETAVAGAPAAEQPLDFSALQDLQAQLELAVDQLQARQLQFSAVQLTLAAAAGQVSLSRFQAGFYQGALQMQANLDARKPAAVFNASGQINSVALQPLLQALASEARLSGAISGNWSANSSGSRVSELQQKLAANLDLNAASLLLASVDVERSACELAALVNTEATPELAWKGATQLRDISLQASVQGEQVNLKQLQAGVENLALSGKGKLDYGSGSFEVPLEVQFVGEVDASRKCQVRERWRNKPLPLRCKGNLNELSARTCLPDRKRLDDLLRDELKDRAQDKVKEAVQKKLGTEKGEAVDQILRGIFNRKDK